MATRQTLALSGAHQIQKADNPRLYRIVENLAITDGLPMPKVYIINDPAPNAFATGRDPEHAVVAATTGSARAHDRLRSSRASWPTRWVTSRTTTSGSR